MEEKSGKKRDGKGTKGKIERKEEKGDECYFLAPDTSSYKKNSVLA